MIMTKVKTKKKKAKAKELSPEMAKVKKVVNTTQDYSKQLEDYLKKNKLDPSKDWTKDKKHGAEVKRLIDLVNLGGEKIKEKVKEGKIEKKPKTKPSKMRDQATEEGKKKAIQKYDYPLVDGRPMTPEERKRYRSKMRAAERPSKPRAKKVKVEKTPEVAKEKKGKDKKAKKKVKK